MKIGRNNVVIAALFALLSVAALGAGCGGDDDGGGTATEADGAFLIEMTAHHEAAVEMAGLAQESAQHREVRDLADAIVASQTDEIEQMEQIHARLFEGSFDEADHGTMGLEEHETGMDGSMADLEAAQPFDRAFIDAMVPHHQGAILMSREVLESDPDSEVAALAHDIIEAQSREIEEMNSWREQWYGEPSPAGGVPAAEASEEEGSNSHDAMGH